MAVITSSVAKITLLSDTSLLVAKITIVEANITFKVAVTTPSLVRIIFLVAGITFKVAIINSSVAKITLHCLR